MEKSKLIKFSLKLSNVFSGKSPRAIYNILTVTKINREIINVLKPDDIIILCFMTPLIKNTKDYNSLYDKIVANLYTFSVFVINSIEDDIECQDCGGNGELTCESCDGTGEIGNETLCDECNGNGYIICDRCDGRGYYEHEGHVSADLDEFVSIDPNLYSKLELLDEENYEENLSDELQDMIMGSNDVIYLKTYVATYDFFNTGLVKKDDVFFNSLNKDVFFSKTDSAGSIKITDLSLPKPSSH